MKLSGLRAPLDIMLLASILDGINLLTWMQSADGRKNRNRPERIVAKITGSEKENEVVGFRSADEFEAVRNRIIEGK